MARTKSFDEQQVLDRAVELFWRKGYHDTSVQELVDYLGINRASMYDTFGDKHQLFERALQHYRDTHGYFVQQSLQEPGNAKEKIRQILDASVNECVNDPHQKGCFMVNTAVELAATDAEIAKLICSNLKNTEALLERVIREGQVRGEITTEKDARALARFIFSSINGLRVIAKVNADRQYLEDVARTTLSVLD